ncbi:MAG: hypothetical protein IKU27_09065, partial [Clostridia bacterium]|nr:hypothetical protein [Clostridia bacterium]
MRKRLLSILLCLCMVMQYIPMTAMAMENVTICDHHPVHDEACGYAEGEEGHPCHFVCTECVTAEEEAEETEETEEAQCICESDDAEWHAPFCALYELPEDPECFCTELCAEDEGNEWCDICYFDAALCAASGEEEAALYLNEVNGVYQIGTAADLRAFADLVDGGTTDIDAVLTADITVNDPSAWKAIGSTNCRYKGTFDGRGHTISGLTYVGGADGTNYGKSGVGLFEYVDAKGVVENVHLTNVNLETMYVSQRRDHVGGIVGYNQGTVRNCSVSGSLAGGSFVGGIVGTMDTGSLVENCLFTGSVTGFNFVGGVTGHNFRGAVRSCGSIAEVTASSEFYAYCGGVLGDNESSSIVENCFAAGSVTAPNNIGSVAGGNSGTVRNCYYLKGMAAGGVNGADIEGTIAAKAEVFASGEVAYMMGEAWGQTIGKENYPVMGGQPVFRTEGGTYTNDCVHSTGYDNGFCQKCGEHQPAELKNGYYQIGNAGQLFWFAQQVNEGGEAGRYLNAVLTDDIDLEDRPWTPIGTEGGVTAQSFRGVFDGNGKTITGLYIVVQKSGLGFFGEVRDGTVKDFTIEGEVYLNSRRDYVGGVIGSACGTADDKGATISGITSYVNVTLGAGAHGSNRVAGLIGYVNHDTLVENCAWYGTLDLNEYRAQDGVGGLVGKVYDNSVATIRNCGAYGTIRTAYKSGSYGSFDTIFIGGILSFSVDKAKTTLENCLWAGTFVNKTDLTTTNARLSAVGTMSGFSSISGVYVLNNSTYPYLTTNGAQDELITAVTEGQMASGEIAYKLGSAWGQTIGKDDYPVPGGEKVWQVYASCDPASNAMTYSNENRGRPEHQYDANGNCENCEVICEHGGNANEDDDDCTTALVCSICSAVLEEAAAAHSYGANGKCENCSAVCGHGTYTDGKCDTCGAVCGHE